MKEDMRLTSVEPTGAPSVSEKRLVVGMTLWVPHPFCWEEASKPGDDPEGPASITFMSWRPGVRPGEPQPPEGECDEVADAMGVQLLTIVDIHKPGRFPERVFYTRQWRDPRGRVFGKGGLRIKTMLAFKRVLVFPVPIYHW